MNQPHGSKKVSTLIMDFFCENLQYFCISVIALHFNASKEISTLKCRFLHFASAYKTNPSLCSRRTLSNSRTSDYRWTEQQQNVNFANGPCVGYPWISKVMKISSPNLNDTGLQIIRINRKKMITPSYFPAHMKMVIFDHFSQYRAKGQNC